MSKRGPVTIERLERAIHIVADVMVKHRRPGLIATIRRLEAERDRLRSETDPMEYAKELLSKLHNNVHNADSWQQNKLLKL
jgi:hypothetical protein